MLYIKSGKEELARKRVTHTVNETRKSSKNSLSSDVRFGSSNPSARVSGCDCVMRYGDPLRIAKNIRTASETSPVV